MSRSHSGKKQTLKTLFSTPRSLIKTYSTVTLRFLSDIGIIIAANIVLSIGAVSANDVLSRDVVHANKHIHKKYELKYDKLVYIFISIKKIQAIDEMNNKYIKRKLKLAM